ncbi:MAG: SAM-dependent methyltransferase [Deltaproteobacteria bacterium]|nr:SAM-dependent methyltransferase [Deltaproteobacteria bacterium]
MFHKSPEFSNQFKRIKPPVRDRKVGVFSTHSPIQPNPLGLSVLEVMDVQADKIRVKGLDMMDKTPILDIKVARYPTETI